MEKKGWGLGAWITFIVSGLLTAAGIVLMCLSGVDMNESIGPNNGSSGLWWCGIILAAIAGMVFLFFIIVFLLSVAKGRTGAGSSNAAQAWAEGKLSQDEYTALIKRARIAFFIVLGLCIAMVVLWFNGFSVFLGIVLAVGAYGAAVLIRGGKKELKGLAFTSGGIAGLILALLSGNQADKEYDYIVNGIRFGDTAENLGGKLMIIAASVFIVGFLIIGVARLVASLCASIKSKQ